MTQIVLPEGRTVDRMTLVKALIRGKFEEDAAEEAATAITTMVTEATQDHATNEALVAVETRLKDHFTALIAQSEARQMRWTMTMSALVIAAVTIIDKVL